MRAAATDWTYLQSRYPPELVDALRRSFEKGGPFEVTAEELSADTEFGTSEAHNS
jgi:hypothetical protein